MEKVENTLCMQKKRRHTIFTVPPLYGMIPFLKAGY